MDLHSVDLNLLVVFQHLYNARRVSRVAEALGVTQPAVSNSLARLRKLFNDELFIRTSRGMLPTPMAVALAEPIAAALDALHGVFNRQLAFDPATSRRAFRIAMTDIGEVHFLPKLMHALGEIAGAAGLTHPSNFMPYHFMFRQQDNEFLDGNEAYPYLPNGFLVSGEEIAELGDWYSRWDRASAESFAPPEIPHGPFVRARRADSVPA